MSGRALAGFLALFFISRVHLLGVEAYDPDEFEHLQAGLMVAQGSVPYRDFFEHHGPLPYVVAWLPAKLVGPSAALLTINRLLSLAFVAVTCWATHRLTRRVAGKRAAPWALVWLLTFPWFADKSLEWRPDVPAMAFVTLAALAVADRRAIFAGLLVGLATLCTQKAGALGLGIAAALILHAEDRRRTTVRFVCGFLAPWAIAAVAFAAAGGFGAFLRCLFYVPAVWPMRVSVGPQLFAIALDHGPASLAAGVAAWVFCWKGRTSGGARGAAWDASRFAVLLHWVAWPLVPAAYLQFHLLGLPLLAVAAARFLRPALTRARRSASRPAAWMVFAVAAGGAVLGMGWSLRHAAPRGEPPAEAHQLLLLVVLGVGLAGPATRSLLRPGLVALFFLVPNARWFFDHHVVLPMTAPVTRATQLAAIKELGRLLPAAARVQDGFTGVGCLHARADYWWWVNEHSLKLLERLDELKGFRARLKRRPPDAYLLDAGLRQALLPLEAEVARDFEMVGRNDALRFMTLRRKAPPGGPPPAP